MATDTKTLERVRRLLTGHRVVEKRMVGGSLGLMVKGKLCVAVKEDRILVRCDKAERLKLLKKPGARPMVMGGRTVTGFLFVDSRGLRTEAQLKGWIRQSLAVIASLPPKKKAKPRRKP